MCYRTQRWQRLGVSTSPTNSKISASFARPAYGALIEPSLTTHNDSIAILKAALECKLYHRPILTNSTILLGALEKVT